MQNLTDAVPIFSCDFEVFGKVQGVLFHKCAQRFARSLGVYGCCFMTADGTAKGHLEAPLPELNEMKFWLHNVGSPKSIIERAQFTPTREILTYTVRHFTTNPPGALPIRQGVKIIDIGSMLA